MSARHALEGNRPTAHEVILRKLMNGERLDTIESREIGSALMYFGQAMQWAKFDDGADAVVVMRAQGRASRWLEATNALIEEDAET